MVGGALASDATTPYPPGLTGMRGSHPGSFEVAHALVQGAEWTHEDIGEDYDLVVVGAGIVRAARARHRAARPCSLHELLVCGMRGSVICVRHWSRAVQRCVLQGVLMSISVY